VEIKQLNNMQPKQMLSYRTRSLLAFPLQVWHPFRLGHYFIWQQLPVISLQLP